MEDIQNTRRRKPLSTTTTTTTNSSSSLAIPSGESSSNGINTTSTTKQQQQQQQSSSLLLLKQRRGRTRRRQRQQRRRKITTTSTKDLLKERSFWILFLQVGIILFLIFFLTFHLYKWIYPSSTLVSFLQGGHNNNNSSEDYYDYDDDTTNVEEQDNTNNYNNVEEEEEQEDQKDEQEVLLQEILDEKEKREKELIRRKKQQQEEELLRKKQQQQEQETIPPLPTFELSELSKFDSFGIYDLILKEREKKRNNNVNTKYSNFWKATKELHNDFIKLYGTKNSARMLLDRTLSTFITIPNTTTTTTSTSTSSIIDTIPSDIITTACRMKSKLQQQNNINHINNNFQIVFGGYSVTAGRGNLYKQSFPFIIQNKLYNLFQYSNLNLTIHNNAIGGCPAFPSFGWCQTNLYGINPDIISWDFSMNEAGDIHEGLEAYIRHVITMKQQQQIQINNNNSNNNNNNNIYLPPKVIIKDTYMAIKRRKVISSYINYLKDPIIIHTEPGFDPILKLQEKYRPIGFQLWRKFGSPLGAPGQAYHHPAVKEHECIGFILSMHLLSSLQLLVYSLEVDEEEQQEQQQEQEKNNNNNNNNFDLLSCDKVLLSTTTTTTTIKQQQYIETTTKVNNNNNKYKLIPLPPPVSGSIINTTMSYPSILFGGPAPEKEKENDTSAVVLTADKQNNNNNNNNTNNNWWYMNPIHCRTTFQPNFMSSSSSSISNNNYNNNNNNVQQIQIQQKQEKGGSSSGDLTSIVVDGTIGENLNVLLPKSHMYYDKGWVLDLSEGEKVAKKKLSLYNNSLGFIDSKQAYYGIYESGKMNLLLPYYNNMNMNMQQPKIGSLAKQYFKSIIICQVNEKRDSDSCNSETDISYKIDGINITTISTSTTLMNNNNGNNGIAKMMSHAGTLFLGKKVCTYITIPTNATLTSRRQIKEKQEQKQQQEEQELSNNKTTKKKNKKQGIIVIDERLENEINNKNNNNNDDEIGLQVEIFVTNRHINSYKQACSVSHVIWEQQLIL